MLDGNNTAGNGIVANLTRRKWLLSATSAAGTIALVGSGSVAAEGAPGCRREHDYDSVVNMVEAGADDSGTEPIDSVLQDNAADGTLLYFPEGEYRIGEFHFSDLTDFGMCGREATLLPEDGEAGTWLFGSDLENFQFEGFTIDNSAPNTGPRVMFFADDGLVVRDIHKRGLHDTTETAFRFQIETEDGEGTVENLRAPDGGGGNEFGANGILVTGPPSASGHLGHLTFVDCHVEGFVDNGLYASEPVDPASIHVIGGLYRNNNISNIRLGQSNSYVKNARVEVTEAPDYWDEGLVVNMRGIRVATGSGVSIENCDVVMTADVSDDRFTQGGTVHSSGAITGANHAGDFSVKNTRITMDMDGFPAIQAKTPTEFEETDWFDGSGPTGIELKNVSITGDAAATNHTDSLFENAPTILISERDQSTFKNVCVGQTGTDRDGFEFVGSDASIENTVVDVSGEPIVTNDSDVSKKNVRYSGNCKTPRRERGVR